MWNVRNLTPPPNFTYRCTTVDVATLKKACLRAVSVLEDQKQLHLEAALLSRFLYGTKTKFRSDKGFDILGKVNRCLLQYLSLNLHATYMNFCECVPDPSDPDQYVPSRQMLQYLLIRTQSFAQLWCYIISHCQEAAQYVRARMGLGHNWWAAVVALAITSRIWAFGKYFIICASEWFSQLKPFLEVLKVNGPPWLPDNYTFPDDLCQWLGTNLQDKKITSDKCGIKPNNPGISMDRLFSVSNDNEIDDDDDNDDDVEIIDNSSAADNAEDSTPQLRKFDIATKKDDHVSEIRQIRTLNEDLGESVARENIVMPLINSENSEYTSDNYSGIGQSDKSYHINNRLKKNKSMDIEMNHKDSMTPVSTRNKKEKPVSKKSSTSITDSSSIPQGVEAQITQIKTHFDLISFVEMEESRRSRHRKSCITHNLDMLQWNMLKNLIYSYVTKLKKKSVSKNKEKYKILMKKARKTIEVGVR